MMRSVRSSKFEEEPQPNGSGWYLSVDFCRHHRFQLLAAFRGGALHRKCLHGNPAATSIAAAGVLTRIIVVCTIIALSAILPSLTACSYVDTPLSELAVFYPGALTRVHMNKEISNLKLGSMHRGTIYFLGIFLGIFNRIK